MGLSLMVSHWVHEGHKESQRTQLCTSWPFVSFVNPTTHRCKEPLMAHTRSELVEFHPSYEQY